MSRADDDDDVYRSENVIIHEQPMTAVYLNPRGQVVIRQRDDFDGDRWVFFSTEHLPALMKALAEIAPYAGFVPLQDKYDGEQEVEQPPSVAAQPPAPAREPDQRELIVAALGAGGKSKRQIAAEIGVSEATVRRVAATLGATLVQLSCDSRASDAPGVARDDATAEQEAVDRDAPSLFGSR
jgi:hypothetical protein